MHHYTLQPCLDVQSTRYLTRPSTFITILYQGESIEKIEKIEKIGIILVFSPRLPLLVQPYCKLNGDVRPLSDFIWSSESTSGLTCRATPFRGLWLPCGLKRYARLCSSSRCHPCLSMHYGAPSQQDSTRVASQTRSLLEVACCRGLKPDDRKRLESRIESSQIQSNPVSAVNV